MIALKERLKYTQFELKNIVIIESKFPKLVTIKENKLLKLCSNWVITAYIKILFRMAQ